jgi:zinc/manganese transport system substrate-binding protein
MRQLILGGLIGVAAAISAAHADPIRIVAAENFYGDIARQIGGAGVVVASVLNNPDQDPHLFELSPSVGRDVSAARVVIYNGLDYDPWMAKILTAARATDRKTIVVGDLIGGKTGDNPHIWYSPRTMLALAHALAETLVAEDPAHKTGYAERLEQFQRSLKPIETKIDELRQRGAGVPVAATEPVFGYMFEALGMRVRDQAFQRAVMNDTEPSASDVAAFEADLQTHKVKLLVYNNQATEPIADRMRKIAVEDGVPVVGASETEPAGQDYQAWMAGELDAIDQALPKPNP